MFAPHASHAPTPYPHASTQTPTPVGPAPVDAPRPKKRKRSKGSDDEFAPATFDPVAAEHRWRCQQGQLKRTTDDLRALRSRCAAMVEQDTSLRQELAHSRESYLQKVADLHHANEQVGQLTTTVDACKSMIAKLHGQLIAHKGAGLDATLLGPRNTEANLRTELAQLNGTVLHQSAEILRVRSTISQREEECRSLRKQLDHARQSDHKDNGGEEEGEVTMGKAEPSHMTGEFNTHPRQLPGGIEQVQRELESANSQISLLQHQLARANQHEDSLAQLQTELREAQQRLVHERQDRLACETHLRNTLSDAQAELAKLRTADYGAEMPAAGAAGPVPTSDEDGGEQGSVQQLAEENRMLRREIARSRAVKNGRLSLLEELAALMRRDDAHSLGPDGDDERMFILRLRHDEMLIRNLSTCTDGIGGSRSGNRNGSCDGPYCRCYKTAGSGPSFSSPLERARRVPRLTNGGLSCTCATPLYH